MRRLENWLRTYAQYTQASESPERFHFWCGVSAIAGALRSKVWFDMGHFRWTPNFYVLLVAPPGIVAKSTSMDLAINILKQVPGITLGPSSVTWQALLESFQESHILWKPNGSSILDASVEMSPLTIAASEFGSFFDARENQFTDILTDLWDGKSRAFERRTKKEGSQTIPNPWINMIACTTPTWVSENLSANFREGGLASRCVFVFSDVKARFIPYPFLETPQDTRSRDQAALLADLEDISEMHGEFTLTGEALDWGQQWYRDVYSASARSANDELFIGYVARKQTQLHKLAMIYSAVRGDSMRIEKRDLERAHQRLVDLEPGIQRIFREMTRDEVSTIAANVLHFLKDYEVILQEKAFREFWTRLSWDSFDQALSGLCNAGIVSRHVVKGNIELHIHQEVLLRVMRPSGA